MISFKNFSVLMHEMSCGLSTECEYLTQATPKILDEYRLSIEILLDSGHLYAEFDPEDDSTFICYLPTTLGEKLLNKHHIYFCDDSNE